MKVIGIRDLRDRLSEVLRVVRQRGSVLVTRHGEVVAELRASYGAAERTDVPEGLRDLAESGSLRIGLPHDPALYLPVPPALAEGTAGRLLDEERGDR